MAILMLITLLMLVNMARAGVYPEIDCPHTISSLNVVVTTTPVTFEKATTIFSNSSYNYGISYNGSVTLDVSGGTPPYNYLLENPQTKQTTGLFTGLAPGTYIFDISDSRGQLVTKTVTVNAIFTQPVISLSNIILPTTCTSADGAFTLTGSGGTPPYSYSIDGGETFNSSGVFTGLIQGYYSFLLVRDAHGLLASMGFNTPLTGQDFSCHCCKIIIFAILSNSSSCDNNTGEVTAEGIYGGELSFSLDGIHYAQGTQKMLDDGGSESDFKFNGLPPGISKIYAKNRTGEIAITAVPVLKVCNITLSSVSTEASCQHKDGSIAVTAQKGVPPYTYSLDGITYQNSNVFTGLGSGNYNYLVKDNAGTISSGTVLVNTTCPLIAATATDGSCEQYNGEISVSGDQGTPPYQFSLDGTNFQNNGDFKGLAAGDYTVTIKDAGGLINTKDIIVATTIPPQIVASTTTATCNDDGTIVAAGTSGKSPLQFSLDNIQFQTANIFTGLPGGTYTLRVNDGNGCSSSQVIQVPLINNLTADAGDNKTVCEGVLSTMNASSNGAVFSWTPAVGLVDSTVLQAQAAPPVTTTYTLIASKGACTATGHVTIQVKPAPLADAGQDTIICYGKNAQLQGSGGNGFVWAPSNYLSDAHIKDPVVMQPLQTMTYNLIVTDAEGCSSIQNKSVTIHVTPFPKVFAGYDTASGYNQTVQLHATDVNHSGFYQYEWTPATGLDNPNIPNPVASFSGDMVYTVSAVAPGGCENSDAVQIKLYAGPSIYVPNAFTPNGDGRNDVLKSIPIGIRTFKYFAVYNRYGQRIFYSNDPGKGWDGTIHGAPQSDKGYVWMVEGIDINGKIIHREGSVLLIR
jgi:gliding motility-associated-like protein